MPGDLKVFELIDVVRIDYIDAEKAPQHDNPILMATIQGLGGERHGRSPGDNKRVFA